MQPLREMVVVGRIVKPHGIRGELVVEPSGGTLGTLSPGTPIRIGEGYDGRLTALRPHQGRWLVCVEACTDRDRAEALRGGELRVDSQRLAPLRSGEWYVHDLVGWQVRDRHGGLNGDVVAVIEGGPHDYLEVRPADGSDLVLVPMVLDWLVETDETARQLLLELPPGLRQASGDRRER